MNILTRSKLYFILLYSLLKDWCVPSHMPLYRDPCAGNDNTLNQFVNKYDDDVKLTFQQSQSRLESQVTADYAVVGQSKSFDTLGQSEMQLVTGTNQDMQSAGTAAARRWIDLADYDWQDFVTTFDKLKVINDPTNKYVQLAVAAGNRTKDRVIINALGGNARETTGAGNAVVSSYKALPAAQKVLHGDENLTLAKIIAGMELILGAEAGDPETEGGECTLVYTSAQLTTLMSDTKITSADYNTLRALQDLKIDRYLGCTWKRVEMLPKDANGIRSNYIFVKNAVGLGVGEDVKTNISQRMDKRGLPWQVYAMLSVGAVRGQDNGVVEIQCKE